MVYIYLTTAKVNNCLKFDDNLVVINDNIDDNIVTKKRINYIVMDVGLNKEVSNRDFFCKPIIISIRIFELIFTKMRDSKFSKLIACNLNPCAKI